MDSGRVMDETIQELQTSVQTQTQGNFFGKMLMMSFLLHLAVSAYFLFSKYQGTAGRSMTYLDLSMTAPATSDTPKTETDVPAPSTQQPIPLPPTDLPTTSEFDKLQNDLQQNLESVGTKQETVQQASLGLGITRGFFRSLAEGETLRDDIRMYYFSMLQNINEKWWIDKNIDRKGIREVVMNIIVARNGEIVAKQLIRGSGNAAYDKEVLKALEAAGPLPPLPESYNGDFFQAPIRLVPPLNLLAS